MADAYATHNVTSAAVNTGDAVYFSGGAVTAIPFNFDTVAADGEVIRVGTVSPQDIYLGVQLINEASSGASDYDLGLYAPKVGDDGRVLDKDIFIDGVEFETARADSGALDYLSLAAANHGKRMYELLGLTSAQAASSGAYELAFTANDAGTAGKAVSGNFFVIRGA